MELESNVVSLASHRVITRRAVRQGRGKRDFWRMRLCEAAWWGYYSVYVPWRGWWGADRGWRDSSAVWAGSPNVSPDAESPWCRRCFARGRRCARSAAQKSPPPRFAASGTLKSNNGPPPVMYTRALFPVICTLRLPWITPIFGNWFGFGKNFSHFSKGLRIIGAWVKGAARILPRQFIWKSTYILGYEKYWLNFSFADNGRNNESSEYFENIRIIELNTVNFYQKFG